MIKLLDYQQNGFFTKLVFEKEQWVNCYKFGKDVYLETSDSIEKSAIKELKQKMNKEGLDCNLDEYIGQEFLEYFEENSYGR